jgi:hypothetical protein
MILLKINLRFSGKDHRRHPYILIMHSISNRNFEIHIFALLSFREKFQDVTVGMASRWMGLSWHRGGGADSASMVVVVMLAMTTPVKTSRRLA